MLRTTERRHSPRFRRRTRLHVEELEARTLLSASYIPSQIRAAYGVSNLNFTTSGGKVAGDGAGQTIAIVDAYYDPTIKTDLAAFSQRFGLPQLDGLSGRGSFTQLDLSNKTLSPRGDDWTVETALDVEWAHAVAPRANILLVEAKSDLQDASTGAPTDLLYAVQTAANAGASVVSMSWGIPELPGEMSWDAVFTHLGTTYIAASGDSGAGTIWPAVSPNVLSVGGTTLKITSMGTISSETGWGNGTLSWYYGGSGGGFSQFETLPAFQTNAGISTTLTQFGARLNPDVAFNADPATGYQVLDGADGGWFVVGGTSAGAPAWAGLTAIADEGRQLAGLQPLSTGDVLKAIYSKPAGAFHDITKGSTGVYEIVNGSGAVIGQIQVTAGPGYDMVTGVGAPAANVLVPFLASPSVQTAAQKAAAPASANGGSTGSGTNPGIRGQDGNLNPGTPPGPPPSPRPPVVFVRTVTALLVNAERPGLLPLQPTLVQGPSALPSTLLVVQAPTSLPGVPVGGDIVEDDGGEDVPFDWFFGTPAAVAPEILPPPALAPAARLEERSEEAPAVPQALDAVFEQGPGAVALPAEEAALLGDNPVAPPTLSAAAVGMAVALALHRRAAPRQSDERERRWLRN